jgi:hypothetical protein
MFNTRSRLVAAATGPVSLLMRLSVRPMVTNSSCNGLCSARWRADAGICWAGPRDLAGSQCWPSPQTRRRPVMARRFCLLVPAVDVGAVLFCRRIQPTAVRILPVVPVHSGRLWPEGRRLPVLTVRYPPILGGSCTGLCRRPYGPSLPYAPPENGTTSLCC